MMCFKSWALLALWLAYCDLSLSQGVTERMVTSAGDADDKTGGGTIGIVSRQKPKEEKEPSDYTLRFVCKSHKEIPVYRPGSSIYDICDRYLNVTIRNNQDENSVLSVLTARIEDRLTQIDKLESDEGSISIGDELDISPIKASEEIDMTEQVGAWTVPLPDPVPHCGPAFLKITFGKKNGEESITKLANVRLPCNTTGSNLRLEVLADRAADSPKVFEIKVGSDNDASLGDQLIRQGLRNLKVRVTNIGKESLGPRVIDLPYGVGMWVRSKSLEACSDMGDGRDLEGGRTPQVGGTTPETKLDESGEVEERNSMEDDRSKPQNENGCPRLFYRLGDFFIGELLADKNQGFTPNDSVWEEDLDISKPLDFPDKQRAICGSAQLVIMVDPTADTNDMNRCNNQQVIDLDIDCGNEPNFASRPTGCSIIPDPTANGHAAMLRIFAEKEEDQLDVAQRLVERKEKEGGSGYSNRPEGTTQSRSAGMSATNRPGEGFNGDFHSVSPYVLARVDGISTTFESVDVCDSDTLSFYGRFEYLRMRYDVATKMNPDMCEGLRFSQGEEEKQRVEKLDEEIRMSGREGEFQMGNIDEIVGKALINLMEKGSGGRDGGNDGDKGSSSGTDRPGTDRPGTDRPGTDRPGTDRPGTDRTGTDRPGTPRPSGESVNSGSGKSEMGGNKYFPELEWGCGNFPSLDDIKRLDPRMQRILATFLNDSTQYIDETEDDEERMVSAMYKEGRPHRSNDSFAGDIFEGVDDDIALVCRPRGNSQAGLLKPEFQLGSQVGLATCCLALAENSNPGETEIERKELERMKSEETSAGCGQEYVRDMLKRGGYKETSKDLDERLFHTESFATKTFHQIQDVRNKQAGTDEYSMLHGKGRDNMEMRSTGMTPRDEMRTQREGVTQPEGVTRPGGPSMGDSRSGIVLDDDMCFTKEEGDFGLLKPDDVYPLYWRVNNGQILRGTKDPLSYSYGKNDGGSAICWTPVAACGCSTCNAADEEDTMTDFHFSGGQGSGGCSDGSCQKDSRTSDPTSKDSGELDL